MDIVSFSKLADYQIAVTIIMVILAWKFGDWKNWKLYYPTMLFYMAGDFLFGLLLCNYPLWRLESPLLKTTFSDILITMVFVPAIILLYLPHFPKTKVKQVLYILSWVFISTLIELFSYLLGFISYHHGWNLVYSALFLCLVFLLFLLHFKKPPLAWLVGFITLIIVILYFHVPLSSIK